MFFYDIPFEGTVQETMLGPLWARAKYSKLYPEILDDKRSSEIITKIDYDFSKIQEYLGEWRGIGLLVRAKNFDNAVIKYIEKFPEATIVNVGKENMIVETVSGWQISASIRQDLSIGEKVLVVVKQESIKL